MSPVLKPFAVAITVATMTLVAGCANSASSERAAADVAQPAAPMPAAPVSSRTTGLGGLLSDQLATQVANKNFSKYTVQLRNQPTGAVTKTLPFPNGGAMNTRGSVVANAFGSTVSLYAVSGKALHRTATWDVAIPEQEGDVSTGPVSVLPDGNILVGVLVGNPPLTADWYGLALYSPAGKLLSTLAYPEHAQNFFFATISIATEASGLTTVLALQCQGAVCSGPGVEDGFVYRITTSPKLAIETRWAHPLFKEVIDIGSAGPDYLLTVPPVSFMQNSLGSGLTIPPTVGATANDEVDPVAVIALDQPVEVARLVTQKTPNRIFVTADGSAYRAYVLTVDAAHSGARAIQQFRGAAATWSLTGNPWPA